MAFAGEFFTEEIEDTESLTLLKLKGLCTMNPCLCTFNGHSRVIGG